MYPTGGRDEVDFAPLENSKLVHVAGHHRLDMWFRVKQVEKLIGILQAARQPFGRVRVFHEEMLPSGVFLIFVVRIDIVMKHHDGGFV